MLDFTTIINDDINQINDNYDKLIIPKDIDEARVTNLISEYNKKLELIELILKQIKIKNLN